MKAFKIFQNRIIPIVVLLIGLQSVSSQEISVDFSTEYQTIEANGINFEGYHTWGGTEVMHSKFNTMLEKMPSQLLRIGMPLKNWEPENDNDSAATSLSTGFVDEGDVNHSFLRLVELDSRGYDLWLTIWDVADWMVSNPEQGYAREINDMDEFVECIVSYLKHARDEYGVEPAYISVNEPSIADENGWGGYQIALTESEQAELIKRSGALFEAEELSTRWALALHKIYPSEIQYAKNIYNDIEAQPYIAILDIHGYWFQNGHDADMKTWAKWASTLPINTFAGECDYDNMFWQRDDTYKWDPHALETALLLHKMYTLAKVNGSLLWYGHYPETDKPYRYANKHYYDYFNPGSVVVETVSSETRVFVSACKHKNNTVALIVQNHNDSEREVTIAGLPDEEMEWIVSKEYSYENKKGNVLPENGKIRVTLEAKSIHIFQSVSVEPDEILPTSVELATQDQAMIPFFPNPFDGKINLNPNMEQAYIHLEVRNIQGQEVANIAIYNGCREIDFSWIPQGLYHFHFSDNKSLSSRSLAIKQN